MTTKVLLDGVLCEPADAKVSVFDRGFLYGDSIYEVVRTYDGRPFALDNRTVIWPFWVYFTALSITISSSRRSEFASPRTLTATFGNSVRNRRSFN